MRLGIFGGTFNPVHMGHITASLKFYDSASLDLLLVIPDRIPPHKEGEIASGKDRMEMLRLAYSDKSLIGDRSIEISDIELLREGKSYTYVTLCELSEQYPDAELFLYAGSDMFYTLESWYRGADILKMCSVVTAAREKDEMTRLSEYAERYGKMYGTECIIMEYEPIILSSTQIREIFSGGFDKKSTEFTKKLLTEGVIEYIMKNGLYSGR